MKIPTLAGVTRLGTSPVDTNGRIRFEENRMVLGNGTSAFTVRDSVTLGVQTQYAMPIILESDKKICLVSDGTQVVGQELCTTAGRHYAAVTQDRFTPAGSTQEYIVIGK
jgi:hypothetical protein